jgi:hypothetical protein
MIRPAAIWDGRYNPGYALWPDPGWANHPRRAVLLYLVSLWRPEYHRRKRSPSYHPLLLSMGPVSSALGTTPPWSWIPSRTQLPKGASRPHGSDLCHSWIPHLSRSSASPGWSLSWRRMGRGRCGRSARRGRRPGSGPGRLWVPKTCAQRRPAVNTAGEGCARAGGSRRTRRAIRSGRPAGRLDHHHERDRSAASRATSASAADQDPAISPSARWRSASPQIRSQENFWHPQARGVLPNDDGKCAPSPGGPC